MTSVDIIVPVHNTDRPIARAVASALAARSPAVGVFVVCHNVSREEILVNLAGLTDDPRLRVVEYQDEERSAAGPRNYAAHHSNAEYLGFLDSDDEYEYGALDTWLSELSDGPELLIGQMSSAGAGIIAAPCPRSGLFEGLHPVKDLLNYRTAPVGVLVKRSLFNSNKSPRYREGFRVGEDIALGAFLWNYAQYIKYSCGRAGYRIREDGNDRVTGGTLSVEEVLSPVRDTVAYPSLRKLSLRKRQALAVKLLRHQVIEFLKGRYRAGQLSSQMSPAVGSTVKEILRFAPGAIGFFDYRDVQIIRALRKSDLGSFARAVEKAEATPHQLRAITVNPFRVFAPEALFVRARRTRRFNADWQEVTEN